MSEVDRYPDLCQEEVDELLEKQWWYHGYWIIIDKRAARTKKDRVNVMAVNNRDPTELIKMLRAYEKTTYFSGIYQLVRPTKKETE